MLSATDASILRFKYVNSPAESQHAPPRYTGWMNFTTVSGVVSENEFLKVSNILVPIDIPLLIAIVG